MFIITPEFKFLDVINYLGPGTSYDKWVKAYGCKQTKSWFQYEWFDSPYKLAYIYKPILLFIPILLSVANTMPGSLEDYPAWYSRQKAEYLLTLQEWRACKQAFRESGMTSFADWLRYYNKLDVGPFIEALQKMKTYYVERGIDIGKDAVSLPGVSLQYLLRGVDSKSKKHAGGPSIVFTRYHEAGVTRIRSHEKNSS